MENAGYLYAAFTLIWALVFGYVLFLVKRQSALKRQIESLKEPAKTGKI
jgi:CcmD family protein